MEDNQWHDPLLLTDVTFQDRSYHHILSTSLSSHTSRMADPADFHPNANEDFSWQSERFESTNAQNFSDPLVENGVGGCSMLGFSLTSPDLVICAGSPDNPGNFYGDSPKFFENSYQNDIEPSIDLSLENGMNTSETNGAPETLGEKMSSLWETSKEEDEFFEASFELVVSPEVPLSGIRINAGAPDGEVMLGGEKFLEDNSFMGGDTLRTEAIIGNGEGMELYQTARVGNFSYKFQSLESGNYVLDLHFAEIFFTDGPPGRRVFDVFMQEQKVVSCLDIYACVGANRPLVISDLKISVDHGGGLSVRFEGVVGSPVICGISVRKDAPASFHEVESPKHVEVPQIQECKSTEDCCVSSVANFQKLRRDYEFQKQEMEETKRILEDLKRENQLKSRECQKAWNSLKELQNELMRKSMHVGSLAFAIEGQVKEKTKWFSSLRDLTRKLKILKMEHIKLSEEALAYKKCIKDINEMSSTIQSTISHQVNLHEDLKVKFIEGAKERKELYNKVLELKGNIRVFCRCRPLNAEEIAAGASLAIDFESAKDGELTTKLNGASKKTFKFDAVFGPQADQVDVFQDTGPFATSVLDGYNVCIFAYGQTGTGKTFTMEGSDEARGVNFRTLEELFHIIKERERQFQYDISVSVLEVYNEQIRDLLVSGTQPGVAAKRLEIRQVGEGTHHVPGLVEAHVKNMSEVWEVLQTGSNARAVGSTNANEHSSRSHCIHCVMVKGENLLNGECIRSKLWLVDLAGSERVAKTEVQGERLKETQNINRSLSALGDVISALATKSPHIPFRNSKLTHLLQDSLGGDSKTLMFVQISPNETDLNETLCSLNFASRVRGIELGPAKKQLDTTELLKYKQMVEKTKQDIKSKDMHAKKMEETIHGLELKMKEKDLKNKNLQDKVKELESQLLIERKLARQHVDTRLAEQQQLLQQQMKQRQEEQSTAAVRPPLADRQLGLDKNFNEPPNSTLGLDKNFNEPPNSTLSKDQVNLTQPPTENKSYKPNFPPTYGLEKENNPEIAEQALPPRRNGRASICTAAARRCPNPIAPAPRRNSLIPLPSSIQYQPPFLPLPTFQVDMREDTERSEDCLPEQTLADSPERLKSGGKKTSSILRRSLHKKMQLKSPMQQHMRKGGVNVGMERVRVSIGSRGRIAHRVIGNGRRVVGTKETQQKQAQKEKRGWNIGTAGRTVL